MGKHILIFSLPPCPLVRVNTPGSLWEISYVPHMPFLALLNVQAAFNYRI